MQAGIDLIRSKLSSVARQHNSTLSFPVVYVARKFPSMRTKDNDTLLVSAIEEIVGKDNLYVCAALYYVDSTLSMAGPRWSKLDSQAHPNTWPDRPLFKRKDLHRCIQPHALEYNLVPAGCNAD